MVIKIEPFGHCNMDALVGEIEEQARRERGGEGPRRLSDQEIRDWRVYEQRMGRDGSVVDAALNAPPPESPKSFWEQYVGRPAKCNCGDHMCWGCY